MKKQIAQYLPLALALLAFIMLLFTAGRNDAPGESTPETTAPVTQTTAPAEETTAPAEETTAPAEETTAPTEAPAPAEETTAPTAATEPRDTGSEPQTADAMARVAQILGKYSLDETAVTYCVYDGELNALESTTGFGRSANANALARLCDEQRMNPVAAFWLLTDEFLYNYTQDESGVLPVSGFSVGSRERREYAFSATGVRELLTDLLRLSGTVEDGLPLESMLLGENGEVDKSQIFREAGDCYYAYFVFYGERSAHFLCFYVRGNEKVDDVEFQLLNLRYADGDADALSQIDRRGDNQAATLMAAAELLLTGSCRADEGQIPFSYSGTGYGATIERYDFNGYDETGTLTNYALHLEG